MIGALGVNESGLEEGLVRDDRERNSLQACIADSPVGPTAAFPQAAADSFASGTQITCSGR
jgi:hypothetical protein